MRSDGTAGEVGGEGRGAGEGGQVRPAGRRRHDALVTREVGEKLLEDAGILGRPVGDQRLSRPVGGQVGPQGDIALEPGARRAVHDDRPGPGDEGQPDDETHDEPARPGRHGHQDTTRRWKKTGMSPPQVVERCWRTVRRPPESSGQEKGLGATHRCTTTVPRSAGNRNPMNGGESAEKGGRRGHLPPLRDGAPRLHASTLGRRTCARERATLWKGIVMRVRTWGIVAVALGGLLLLLGVSLFATKRRVQEIYTQLDAINVRHREVEGTLAAAPRRLPRLGDLRARLPSGHVTFGEPRIPRRAVRAAGPRPAPTWPRWSGSSPVARHLGSSA